MKLFILKSCFFILFLYLGLSVVSWVNQGPDTILTNYSAIIIDKHERLEKFKDNRLLLVGGSNLAFGIDSKKLGNDLSMNVVNFGFHARLGLEFILNEAKESMIRGDVVVLAIEYVMYDDSFETNKELIHKVQNYYPPSTSYFQIGLKDRLKFYLKNKQRILKKETNKIHPVYNRKLFNSYGDMIGHLNKPSKRTLLERAKLKAIKTSISTPLLKAFHTACASTGVKTYISFPCYPISEYAVNQEVLDHLFEKLQQEVPEIEILNTPKSFTLHDSLFYDSVYHRKKKGRQKRTELLSSSLKNKLK
jgi:hypothetical protein